MPGKVENISFEAIVADAFARMKAATSAAPGYQVDRDSGQWIVRRAPTTSGVLVPEAGAALAGSPLADADIERAAALAQAQAKPLSDMRGSADYRRHLVGVLVKRALRIALQRAKGG